MIEWGANMEEYIIINRIKCAHCGDILVSNNRNDLKFCSCKKVGIDGGREYLRRIFDDKFDYFDLSESIKIDEDYIVVYKELKKKILKVVVIFATLKRYFFIKVMENILMNLIF